VTGLPKIDAAKRSDLGRQPTAAAVLVSWRRPASVGVGVRCTAGFVDPLAVTA
jgi:hypothetical protein